MKGLNNMDGAKASTSDKIHSHWKYVSADDWVVLYNRSGRKVYEGHSADSNAVKAILAEFGTEIKYYQFTDEDEIDGGTPDHFDNIKGLGELS